MFSDGHVDYDYYSITHEQHGSQVAGRLQVGPNAHLDIMHMASAEPTADTRPQQRPSTSNNSFALRSQTLPIMHFVSGRVSESLTSPTVPAHSSSMHSQTVHAAGTLPGPSGARGRARVSMDSTYGSMSHRSNQSHSSMQSQSNPEGPPSWTEIFQAPQTRWPSSNQIPQPIFQVAQPQEEEQLFQQLLDSIVSGGLHQDWLNPDYGDPGGPRI